MAAIKVVADTGAVREELLRTHTDMTRPRVMMRTIGAEIKRAWTLHFKGLPPNKKGWKSKQFWKKEGADKITAPEVTDTSVTVGVSSRAMAHKYEGGRISAASGKFLAIPVNEQAYSAGRPALGKIKNLTAIVNKKTGKGVLLQRGKKKQPGTVFYALVRSVIQDADTRPMLPSNKVLEAIRKASELVAASNARRAAKP